jgi:TonB family protein
VRVIGGIFVAALLALEAPALGQEVLRDVADPSITKKPRLDPKLAYAFEYPAQLLRARVQGDVSLKMCVSERGAVTSLELTHSSGNAELDVHTLSTVGKVRILPAEADGVKVAVCGFRFSYQWRLPPS